MFLNTILSLAMSPNACLTYFLFLYASFRLKPNNSPFQHAPLWRSPVKTQPFFFPKLPKPSPSLRTIFLGNTSTFLLSSSLTSGLIPFGLWSANSSPSTLGLDPLLAFPLPLALSPSEGVTVDLPPWGLLLLFVLPAVTVSTPLVLPTSPEERRDWTPPNEAFVETGRCRSFGLGKLDFLSIASTVLWKRRKSASARTRVDSRSIVVESSFTSQWC